MASVGEISFSLVAFGAAMTSNASAASRSVLGKKFLASTNKVHSFRKTLKLSTANATWQLNQRGPVTARAGEHIVASGEKISPAPAAGVPAAGAD